MFKFFFNFMLVVAFACLINKSNAKSIDNLGIRTLNNVKSVNGGNNCLTCTIVVALVEQLSIVYNQTAERSLQGLCKFLPNGIFRSTCQQAVKEYGSIIINGLIL